MSYKRVSWKVKFRGQNNYLEQELTSQHKGGYLHGQKQKQKRLFYYSKSSVNRDEGSPQQANQVSKKKTTFLQCFMLGLLYSTEKTKYWSKLGSCK